MSVLKTYKDINIAIPPEINTQIRAAICAEVPFNLLTGYVPGKVLNFFVKKDLKFSYVNKIKTGSPIKATNQNGCIPAYLVKNTKITTISKITNLKFIIKNNLISTQNTA